MGDARDFPRYARELPLSTTENARYLKKINVIGRRVKWWHDNNHGISGTTDRRVGSHSEDRILHINE